jgi:hypothetical protein
MARGLIDEIEIMWKGTVVTCLKLSLYLPGGTGKDHRKPHSA